MGPGRAVETLGAENMSQLERKLLAGSSWKPTIEGLVFTHELGSAVGGTRLLHLFQQALRAGRYTSAEIRHLRIYTARSCTSTTPAP